MIEMTGHYAGAIGYHGLEDWWENSLTESERDEILARYDGASHLTEGSGETTASASNELWCIGEWFSASADRHLGLKIATEALRLARTPIDKHFAMLLMIKLYYYDRNDPDSLQSAINVCRAVIEMQGEVAEAFKHEYPDAPLPKHPGYRQLCIIEEKRKNYAEALRLTREADMAGWNGDWTKRGIRLNDKMR